MAFSRIVFTVLFLTVSCYASSVPVFLWGDLAETSSKANPLETIPEDKFKSVLKKEITSDNFVVAFIEETISPEDFSRKNVDRETLFPYLHENLKNSMYLPSVDSPVSALDDLVNAEKVDHFSLTEKGLSAEIDSYNGRFLIVTMKDAREGESRADMLRRHNDFMEDMFEKLKNDHERVIAIYTAVNPSWIVGEAQSRIRRQVQENSNNTNAEDYSFEGLRLYVKVVQVVEANTTTTLSDKPTAISSLNDTLRTMTTTMNFGQTSFDLNFRDKSGYWFLDSVTFGNEELYPVTELFALSDFSYRCAQRVVFSSGNATKSIQLVFEDLQVQPFFTNVTNSSVPFGDTFDCVGFFSAPIWAGLFVVFILLSITFYGIMMMMDIRTMDRFDDPKGKTITINTAE